MAPRRARARAALLALCLATLACGPLARPAAAAASITCDRCTCSSQTAAKIVCVDDGRTCVPESTEGGNYQVGG